jgi:hypothetical protein
MQLHPSKDADIIQWLNEQPIKQAAVMRLIRAELYGPESSDLGSGLDSAIFLEEMRRYLDQQFQETRQLISSGAKWVVEPEQKLRERDLDPQMIASIKNSFKPGRSFGK